MQTKVFLLIIAILSLTINGEEKEIVEIAGKRFSNNQIQKYFSRPGLDPMAFVNKTKRAASIQLLCTRFKVIEEKELYQKLMGTSIDNDLKTIQSLSSDRVSCRKRLQVFEEQVRYFSEHEIPIKFLDPKAFWSMVILSEGFKSRVKSGITPSMENWRYTWYELSVNDNAIVATIDRAPYFTGKTYNQFLREYHFECPSYQKTREQSLNEAQKEIVEALVDLKIAANIVAKDQIKFSKESISNSIDRLCTHGIKKNLIEYSKNKTTGLALESSNEDKKRKWQNTNDSKVKRLRELCNGAPISEDDELDILYQYFLEARNNLHLILSERTTEDEVKDALQRGLTRNQADARNFLVSEKYRNRILQEKTVLKIKIM